MKQSRQNRNARGNYSWYFAWNRYNLRAPYLRLLKRHLLYCDPNSYTKWRLTSDERSETRRR
jgi:hypothetical protein